jgi:hypothetical protein
MYGRTRGLHHRPNALPHRVVEGGHACGQTGPAGHGPDHCRACSSRWDTPPPRSARITWAIATNIFLRCMASTNSTAFCTTSTRWKSRTIGEYPKRQGFPCKRFGPRNIICTAPQQTWTIRHDDPRWGRVSASRPSPMPVRCRPIQGMDPAAKVSMQDVDVELVRALHAISWTAPRRPMQPFFLWHNSTRCHCITHLCERVGRQDRVRAVCGCHGRT